jgi:hypothetical protein
MSATTLSDLILTAGGYNGSALNYTYYWDTSTWSAKQTLITATYSAAMVGGFYDAIYVGGRTSGSALSTSSVGYDLQTTIHVKNIILQATALGEHDGFLDSTLVTPSENQISE